MNTFDQLDTVVRDNFVFIKHIIYFFITVSIFIIIAILLVVFTRLDYQRKQVRQAQNETVDVRSARYLGWNEKNTNVQQ
ncbi:hypothetical protein SlGVgp047 [Spodoptera litura granulovirus]|uniref:Uncharacterized protein n=1 Tax=Spodoptera litura granulovirus TaxID=359919 RepID=A5IZP9_9BBAC|nr:hypothetical protein SlGVgp047 [Spodoptera litura granulovirus]ABQ51990.1 hypothetical protein SlGVgp047 [Spodoptera litura granulovirus]